MFEVKTDATAATPATSQTTPATTTPASAPAAVDVSKLDKNSKEYLDAMTAKGRAAREAREKVMGTRETVEPDEQEQEEDSGTAAPAAETQEEPKLILGKFKTVADLEKAYAELEKRQSQAKPKTEATTPENTEAATEDQGAAPEAAAEVSPEALEQEYASYSAEFINNNGDLSEETKQSLYKKHGQAIVDQHLKGLRAEMSLAKYKACEVADITPSRADTLVAWAATGLTAGEKVMFNKANQGTPEEAGEALKWLVERHAQVTGKAPARTFTGGDSPQVTEGFQSKAEMLRAMQDPRYKTDEAYRKDVMRKVSATSRAKSAR